MKPALAVLGQVLHFNDKEVLSHACRALYYLFDGSRETSQSFIAAGLVQGLVQLLGLVLTPKQNFKAFATCLDNEGGQFYSFADTVLQL